MALSTTDFFSTIYAEIVSIIGILANTPYMLGLILPVAFILMVFALATMRSRGSSRQAHQAYRDVKERPQIVIQRGQSSSGLRIILTSALSSVIGAIIMVYILPTLGIITVSGLTFQTAVIILFVVGIVAAILVWMYTVSSGRIQASTRS